MEPSSLYQTASVTFWSMPVAYKFLCAVLVIVALNKVLAKPKGDQFKSLPAYLPIELAVASYILSGDGIGRRIYSAISRYGGSLFGLTSGHQILAELPGVDHLLSQSHHVFSSSPSQYSLCTLVLGAVDSPELRRKFEKSLKERLPPLERIFLNDAASTAAVARSRVAERGASLVSFSSDVGHMARWELSAGIKVIQSETSDSPGKVEANMQNLLRDFGACMSIPLIYGQDLLDRSPTILDDLWVFDHELFPLLMVGIPSWVPFKKMQDGLKARARIIDSLEGIIRRVEQDRKGEPIDFGADIADVSTVLRERNAIYARDGWTMAERAPIEFGTFWALNANTQPALFWFLLYVYSTPGLAERIRDEIAPYVSVSKGNRPEIVSMDFPSLFRKCQLFKACILETYRLVNQPTAIRCVTQPISINDGDIKHNLNKGTYVSVPLALKNRDPSLYEDPEVFVPDRFLEVNPDTGKPTAKYGKLRPWGIGPGEDYHFVSLPEFSRIVAEGGFIEHTIFSGDHHGTSKEAIPRQNGPDSVILLDIEIEGVKAIHKSQSLDARYVFIKPPSFEALETRLRARGTEGEIKIQERLARARTELEYAKTSGVYDKIIISDDLDVAYESLKAFAHGIKWVRQS
ncbi:cytochrome P450 monooxygenase [Fusarium heterosporum]|uniref:Cytochrome P450 monooxygenase n=1 Tax=Fusarium heterosporum TaxID=42747 RepID=A0A8H5TU92_FUSHE|nr:cytochrome P450 monooxygenase [Fusarium heterosporum]